MSRSLFDFGSTAGAPAARRAERSRVDRTTARALAAAISSLAIASLVVSESVKGLQVEGTVATNQVASGTITLADDDQGRSLVALDNMAPGRPVEECITVTYTGSVLPVQVSLGALSDGDIAPYVDLRVERGEGGRFGDCSGFVPTEESFVGTLAELEDDPITLAAFRTTGEELSLRFTFDLVDSEDAVDRAGSVDFVWEAEPS